MICERKLIYMKKKEVNFLLLPCELDKKNQHSIRLEILIYSPSSSHRFDSSQHERFCGKALLHLQLGHLQAITNVCEVAGSLENLGHQVGILQVAKLELCEGFFQCESRSKLTDAVELPGRLSNRSFSSLVGSALGQAFSNDAWF